MAVNDVYQVNMMGRLHSQLIINTLHYKQVDGGSVTGSQFVTALRTSLEVEWLACHSLEYSLIGITFQKIRPIPVNVAYIENITGVIGTVAANSLPTSVAATLTKRTAIAGTGGRGRLYMSGVPTSFEDDSLVNNAGQVTYAFLCDRLDQVVLAGGANFQPVLFKRSLGTTLQITTFDPRVPLRSQRRRQVGRGS